ncbi:metal-dependent hydrolase [Zavarzinia sp. CC-PAN008]|uniref:metal-dependent hydrolase n=1 Tax=Zavarzinia sp. CC-PAN008 TaxID=3243332 RepID=UPI003F746913
MTLNATPADLVFRPRNEHFDLEAVLASDWAGEPVETAFWNALSSLFPVGETFFVDSVKHFAPQITDEKLRREIRSFIGQETVHSREHQTYNETLCRARGVDLAELEQKMHENNAWAAENVPPIGHLAITVAYEHFTAILADVILRDPRWTANMPPEMRRLWTWHAIEETEHKAVAYDVFLAVGGERKHLRKALLYVSKEFAAHVLRNGQILLRNSGVSKPRAILGLSRIVARLLWATRREFLDFFRRDFHPWRHDNRALLARALATYGEPHAVAA